MNQNNMNIQRIVDRYDGPHRSVKNRWKKRLTTVKDSFKENSLELSLIKEIQLLSKITQELRKELLTHEEDNNVKNLQTANRLLEVDMKWMLF
tara:strand:- start:165 stop:443 length:279 start_codon:yes stop_codon:yes gene_type:complete